MVPDVTDELGILAKRGSKEREKAMTFSVGGGGAVTRLYALESGTCNRVRHSAHDDDEVAAYLSKLPCLLQMYATDAFPECLFIARDC
jgi:hypothetical protein